MTRSIHKLTDRRIMALKKPGHIADGGGLYVRVRSADAKSWSFIYRRGELRTEVGLGAYPALTLAKAREQAAAFRETLANGGDPKALRDKESEPVFAEAVKQVIASMEGEWSNAKHRAQWTMTLGPAYCGPIQRKLVSEIGLPDILAILKPVWSKKPETASRLRGRLERVLAYCRTKGWRAGENPAAWRGNLDTLLAKPSKLKGDNHHAALPYAEVPAFLTRLRAIEGMSALALEFQILTACRSGEVLQATWTEIDLEACLWRIPASRMKARREHVVPLSEPAMAVLRKLEPIKQGLFVFAGQKAGRPLSDMALTMLLRRLKLGVTAHGFRSSFRDWAGDATNFQREVAEAALAHVVGDKAEQAYRRSTAIEKRRQMMNAWADYCSESPISNVVILRA
jgi:integrase